MFYKHPLASSQQFIPADTPTICLKPFACQWFTKLIGGLQTLINLSLGCNCFWTNTTQWLPCLQRFW